jgi:predicted RNase H-like HicB family nuclease
LLKITCNKPEQCGRGQNRFTVVIEPDEDAFHAYAPALPGCHTFGATVEEAQANIREAMALHVESMLADGDTPPKKMECRDLGIG